MPSLRIILSSATLCQLALLAPAAEINPTVHAGGFVDVVGLVGAFDDNNRGGNAAFGAGDHIAPIFKGLGEVQLGGKIESDVAPPVFFQADYEVFTNSTGGSDTRLEQLYIRVNLSDELVVKAGRFEDWIGFERNDSPTWYRTRLSPLAQLWHGIAETGVNVAWQPTPAWRFDAYVVNGIWSETGIVTAGVASKRSQDLGYGARATTAVDGVGEFKLGGAFDAGSHLAQKPGASSPLNTWSAFVSGKIDVIRESTGVFGFFDIEYVDYDEFAGYGATGGLVKEFTPNIALALAITWLNPNDADSTSTPYQNPYNKLSTGTNPATGIAGGTYGKNDELTEYCLSLVTHPTGNRNFFFNVEVAWQSHAQHRADVAWLDLQLIAVIP